MFRSSVCDDLRQLDMDLSVGFNNNPDNSNSSPLAVDGLSEYVSEWILFRLESKFEILNTDFGVEINLIIKCSVKLVVSIVSTPAKSNVVVSDDVSRTSLP